MKRLVNDEKTTVTVTLGMMNDGNIGGMHRMIAKNANTKKIKMNKNND